MANFNMVILAGNLVSDPETRITTTGSTVCNFRLAVNRNYISGGERKQDVSYFDCEIWGKSADNFSRFMSKGRGVLIEGHLRQDVWKDKDDKNRSKIVVFARDFQFLDNRKSVENTTNDNIDKSKLEPSLDDLPI